MAKKQVESAATEEAVVETPHAPKAKEAKPKKAKANIFVRFGNAVKKFWKEYVSELKKVAWMSWKDIKKNTLLVIVAVAVFSVAIAIVDTCLGEIIDGLSGLVG